MTPAARALGMDHDHYTWSPLPQRKPLRWPAGEPLALAVVILVEHVELWPPDGTVQVNLPGGVVGSSFPFPNLPFLAHREYGHRIGVFRLLDALAAAGVPPTVAIDAMAAERYPYIVQACTNRGAEFVAHGISATRIVTSRMPVDDERAYIIESRDRLAAATGRSVKGWYGPEQSESERTPELLDELGFEYVCDWPNDEQPYRMSTAHGLVAVPTSFMLDDGFAVWGRPFSPDVYPELVARAAATLARDGRASARSVVLVLRPWLSGQPFRIAAVERALAAVREAGDVWTATTGELAAACRAVSD
jgi:peptidoglycan/xylan/chitin deacetylase (PgdA/CDA1 family)